MQALWKPGTTGPGLIHKYKTLQGDPKYFRWLIINLVSYCSSTQKVTMQTQHQSVKARHSRAAHLSLFIPRVSDCLPVFTWSMQRFLKLCHEERAFMGYGWAWALVGTVRNKARRMTTILTEWCDNGRAREWKGEREGVQERGRHRRGKKSTIKLG